MGLLNDMFTYGISGGAWRLLYDDYVNNLECMIIMIYVGNEDYGDVHFKKKMTIAQLQGAAPWLSKMISNSNLIRVCGEY